MESQNRSRAPTLDFSLKWAPSVFEETLIQGTGLDARYLGVIEIDDSHDKEHLLERMFNGMSHYEFIEKTPAEALALANEWHGEGSFELDTDGFTLVDLRE